MIQSQSTNLQNSDSRNTSYFLALFSLFLLTWRYIRTFVFVEVKCTFVKQPTKTQSLPIKGAWDDLPVSKVSQWHCRKGAWKRTCWLGKGSTCMDNSWDSNRIWHNIFEGDVIVNSARCTVNEHIHLYTYVCLCWVAAQECEQLTLVSLLQ